MGLTRYNCFIGTTRGILLSTTDKPKEVKKVKPDFSSEVTALAFNNDQKEIIIGYKNGILHRYDPLENSYLSAISDLEGKGSIVGVGGTENLIIAGKQDGIINLWKSKKKKHFSLNLDVEGSLNSMVINKSKNLIGTGGEKNDFKLWDIETQKCVFKAKSMGHDKLNLPISTSITGISFLHEDPNLSSCCTKEGYVLVYDERSQRRPVVKLLEVKASYTTISSAFRERQCLVGTTKGYMQLLDMKIGKCLKTFSTFTGSVTSIVCDPLEPYILSTSLDRHLRVHDIESKSMLHKVYLKVNLTSLLVRPTVKEESQENETDADKCQNTNQDVDEEYENIFDNMETVYEETKKKTKRTLDKNGEEEIVEKRSKKKVKKAKTTIKNIFAK